jgi:hypothetical protein
MKTTTYWAGYGLALALGLCVAAAGYISSFNNLATYASGHGFAWGWLLPVGLDLGIPALLILDWLQPSLFLRTVAWALSAGTVLANGAVAGGGLTDRALHAVMPAVAILIIEAGRHLQDDPSRMDKIRLSRWLLSPVRTGRLKRRMVLWEITSYDDALKRESAILHARTVLAAVYGHRYWWATRRDVPATLLHQIGTGQLPTSVLFSSDLQTAVRDWVHQALADIAAAPSPVTPIVTTTGHDCDHDCDGAEQDPWVTLRVTQYSIRPEDVPADIFAAAIGLAEHHFSQVGKLPTVEYYRTTLGTAQARAAAIRKAIQYGFENPSVTAYPGGDSAPAAGVLAGRVVEYRADEATTHLTGPLLNAAQIPA